MDLGLTGAGQSLIEWEHSGMGSTTHDEPGSGDDLTFSPRSPRSPHRRHSRKSPDKQIDAHDLSPKPLVRMTSQGGKNMRLRHPTPDLQSLQGAYVKNVERLEQSAERLSMGSSIEVEVRKLREEQKRSESRHSSLLNTPIEEEPPFGPLARQPSASSYSNSIVGFNNAARSGGYSPSGIISLSRNPSLSKPSRGRSASKNHRLSQLPEPELEGRPLESFASTSTYHSQPPQPPPHAAFAHDIDAALNGEPTQSSTSGLASHPHSAHATLAGPVQAAQQEDLNRPTTSASTNTYRHTGAFFEDFDGVHCQNGPITAEPDPLAQSNEPVIRPGRPRARPQTYANQRHQDMVFYPAPVPMTLNLPQRLSKQPNPTQMEKQRIQVLGSVPAAARKSAAWLPNLVEGEHYEEQNKSAESLNRKSKDLQRSTQNLAPLPAQLRASVFFDRPTPRQEVAVKDNSAVATLDSILDASAVAPVNAFTDHPIVGQLGADVYKREVPKKSSTNQPTEKETEKRKSRSSVNLLTGKGKAVHELDEMRSSNRSRASFASLMGFRKPGSEEHAVEVREDRDDQEPCGETAALRPSQEGQRSESGDEAEDLRDRELMGHEAESDNEVDREVGDGEEMAEKPEEYNGPPTTLLAELQLRKAEMKMRNRTAATAFPDGMHSTLLELDAVAQLQKKSRAHKRIALAWEDPDVHAQEDEDADDDDVPLGLLFPGRDGKGKVQTRRLDDNRPLGLMERRELEESEPLANRRARLRGEPIPTPQLPLPPPPRNPSPEKRAGSMYTLEVPGLTDQHQKEVSSDSEEETMAQRRARLKARTGAAGGGSNSLAPASRHGSSTFADELLSQFGGLDDKKTPDPCAVSPHEETLGQRRARLKAEAKGEAQNRKVSGNSANSGVAVKERHSMATILQAHPIGSAGSRALGGGQFRAQGQHFAGGFDGRSAGPFGGAYAAPYTAPYGGTFPLGMNGMNGIGPYQQQQQQFQQHIAGGGGFANGVTYAQHQPQMQGYGQIAGGYGGPMYAGLPGGYQQGNMFGMGDELPLDPKQRDVIDSWRRSVMP
ncbi:MAG: hypothetical protein M1824_000010 [Vezdaea acicularis]|nr:MAG: hypothetical protein M1824_000010 [Vezdaea acicularis]